jgi:hypothetical protein
MTFDCVSLAIDLYRSRRGLGGNKSRFGSGAASSRLLRGFNNSPTYANTSWGRAIFVELRITETGRNSGTWRAADRVRQYAKTNSSTTANAKEPARRLPTGKQASATLRSRIAGARVNRAAAPFTKAQARSAIVSCACGGERRSPCEKSGGTNQIGAHLRSRIPHCGITRDRALGLGARRKRT